MILREYGKLHHIPELDKLGASQITDSFNLERMLAEDAKVPKETVAKIFPGVQKFSSDRFFSNDYIQYDVALPGAVEFVTSLHKKGITIVYITGRDSVNMQTGTIQKLKSDGFPMGVERVHIFMKPKSSKEVIQKSGGQALIQGDQDWKEEALKKAQSLGTVVASFENEPSTINLYFNEFHKTGTGVAVFVRTDESPKKVPIPLENGVVTISGFLR